MGKTVQAAWAEYQAAVEAAEAECKAAVEAAGGMGKWIIRN